ncbi:MAG TPA: IS110 family transposase [Pyrinomonadaceae bacterium]|nr:IS110 family transposase [Pyrinomonadaceae bacterium]
MTGQPEVSRFIPSEYDIFAGLDVDKRNIAMTFTDHQTLIKSLRLPYSSTQVVNYVRKHFPGQRVAFVYEAGPTGFGLHDDLVANHFPCLVVAPSMVPRAPGQRVKTNRLDSKKLSLGLRSGELRSIHVPSRSYRELRHLVQLRDTQVQQVTATKLRIKALLLCEGIPFPEAPPSSQWSARVVAELRVLPCTAEVRFKLDHLIGTLYFHFNSAAVVQKRIRHFCQNDPELRQSISLLMSLPGIGWIVAAHLVARLGDWREIKNVRSIASFFGLVSSEHSTGDKVNRGSITRSGDSRLRNKLIQSAWVAIAKDPELRAFYRRIFERHPKKVAARKAIVAVARKLTTRMYAVLKQQRPYVIRPDISTTPLTTEETVGPRERLDAAQSDQP